MSKDYALRIRLRLVFLLVLGLSSTGFAQPDQVKIKGGAYAPQYLVGDKVKLVQVKAFWLDRDLVTNEQFRAFVEANPKWRRSRIKPVFSDKRYLHHWSGDLDLGSVNGDSPVVNVSWFAARAYARWAGKRLPSQDEWEFVGRADEKTNDATDDPAFHARILAWYGKPSPNPVPSVGTTFKNFYGVRDMHGLVWEWVEDFNTVFVTGESRQDTGLDRNLYCAGGAINATDPSDYAAYMRYAYRSSLQANYTVGNLGFRCAKDL